MSGPPAPRPSGGIQSQLTLAAALLVPPAITVALVPFRDSFANTNAALVLVLLVVAVAAWSGRRLPGVLTAISAGLWFDYFLTTPYEHLSIDNRADVETALLLLFVGLAVSELAVWGRRQHDAASRQAGYLAGIAEVAEIAAGGSAPAELVEATCRQLTRLLGLRRCRFDDARGEPGLDHARLCPDGQVEIEGAICDIEHYGLPTEQDIELLLFGEGGFCGRFVFAGAPGARPSLAQRLAAVALADNVAAALSGSRRERSS